MSEPFIGQVTIFAGNFAPRGWAICDGRLLSIAQNSALFAILGTTYGGDGQVTFALPDLRGRAPIGTGNGPGLTSRALGEAAGTETVTLTVPEMPAHTHTLVVSTTAPGGAARALEGELTPNPITTAEGMGVSGGSQPHENMQPYLALNYIIALQGIFPSRN
jgi:microcystin-dependent protein